MTPLTKIENGILSGDWQLVCDGFNKLTGKKLIPPAPPKQEVKFDPLKANKRALYAFLKSKIEMDTINAYSIDELREMSVVHTSEEESEGDEEVVIESSEDKALPNGGKFLDGFRYTTGRSKLLPIDQERVVTFLDPMLKNVGDPQNEYRPRNPPKKITVKCMTCKTAFRQTAGIAVEVDNELKSLCPKCSETVR